MYKHFKINHKHKTKFTKEIKYSFEVSEQVDTTAPVITLNGDNPTVITKGDAYIEEGATAIDNVDGNVSTVINSNVDTSIVGSYIVTYTSSDSIGNNARIERIVEVVEPPVVLESLELTGTQSALRISQSISFNLIGTYSDGSIDDITNQAEYFTSNTQISSIIGNTLEALAEGTTTVSATIGNVTSSSVTISIHPELDTTNFSAINFGSAYTDKIPSDATKTQYDEKLFCMTTGKIVAEDGVPLSSVKVTIHNHSEYGSQLTDVNGKYVFASEGGRYITIRYSKDGYTTIDRKLYAPAKEWSIAPTVTMLKKDEKVTLVKLGTSTPSIHTSTPVIDDRGERATTLVFNNISKATITAKDGSIRELTDIAVRATEFKTPDSMPANLPKESAYTYCSDLKVDGVGDDENVSFDSPVIMYVDNFLGFNIGEIVPIGYYDRNNAKWKGSKNGVVVQLLDTDGDGIVDALDSDGDNLPNDLNSNGSFMDEVAGIMDNTNYTAGKSYWRAEITHFTPWDHNWPYGPPSDAESPEEPDVADQTPPDDCNININSYVTAKTRVFHEDVPIVGTDKTLHYSSKRVDGYKHVIDASFDTTNIPSSVKGVTVKLEIAGHTFIKKPTIEELNNLQFTWDGKDILGNKLTGEITAKLIVSYEYDLVYYRASSVFTEAWAQAGTGSIGVRGRSKLDMTTSKSIKLKGENTIKNNSNIANGWTLSNVNFLGTNIVYKGDGTKVEKEVNLDDGLVAYYSFDKDAKDYSGKNNHATVFNTLSYDKGVIGNAAYFNGTQNVKTPIELIGTAENQNITISLWGKADNSINSIFISNYNIGDGSNSLHISAASIGITGGFFGYYSNGFCYKYRTIDMLMLEEPVADSCGNINTVDTIYDYGEEPIDYTTWHHYVFTYDNLYERVYIDGSKVVEKELENNMIGGSNNIPSYLRNDSTYDRFLNIGQFNNIFNYSSSFLTKNMLKGAIDDVRIYKKVLKDEMIYSIYQYGTTGTISTELDSFNISDGSLEYKFDIYGNHLSTNDLYTKTVFYKYAYDESGKLIAIEDQFNNTTTITRDQNGAPTLITAPNGQKTYLNVDANGDLISVQYEDYSDYQFEYDSGSLMTKETDPNGNVFTHLFDENGRIYQDTDSIGGNWKFMKDGNGKVATYTMTKPEGDETSSTDTKQSDGSTLSQMTLPSGDTISITTSSDAKQVRILKGGVSIKSIYTVDSLNQQKILSSTTTTQPSGLNNQVVSTTNYDGTQIHTNSKTQTISSNSKTATIVSDYNNATETITTPESRVLKRDYDKDTLLTTAISSGTLNPTTYEYDSKGRVVKESSGTRATNYSYDSKGNIATFINAKGEVTNYTYDVVGRVTTISYSNGTVENYEYDFNGNMTKLTTPTPSNFNFNYNGIDKRVSLTSPLNLTTSYTYNKNRNLSSIVRPSTKTITNTYTADRLTSTATPEGTTNYTYLFADTIGSVTNGSESITYGYDGELLTSLTQNGILNQSINYTYNNDFAVTSAAYAGETTSLTYDNDRLLISSGDFTLSRDTANGYVTNISDGTISQNINYNNFGEISKVSDSTFTYELSQRDNSGAITQKRETINGVDTVYDYIYDNKARLTAVSKNNQEVENYTYDNNGNRLQATVNSVTTQASYTLDDNLEVYGDNTYSYDEDGYLVEKTTPSETTTYTYNTLGALTSVTTPTKTIIYHLNALNQRVAKEIDGVITEKYLWLNLTTLLAVYDGNNNLVQRFNYADNRMPISMTMNNQTYYLHHDQVGTLRAVTDKNQNIIKEITYDTFGNILQDTNPNLTIPFGFAGGVQDSDTGLVHFGYREYDPYTGKWTSKDPIDFSGGDSNLYGYVLQNPVNLVDPEGLMSLGPFIGAATLWYAIDQYAQKQCEMKQENNESTEDFLRRKSDMIEKFRKDTRDVHIDTLIQYNKPGR